MHERWEKLNKELKDALQDVPEMGSAAPVASKAKAKKTAKAKAAEAKAKADAKSKAIAKAKGKGKAKAKAKALEDDHDHTDGADANEEFEQHEDVQIEHDMPTIAKTKQCRVTPDGQRKVLAQYADPSHPDEWIPEDALPLELKEALNPNMDQTRVLNLQENIEFQWAGQKFIAKVFGAAVKSKIFPCTKWRGSEKAEAAAIKWCKEELKKDD